MLSVPTKTNKRNQRNYYSVAPCSQSDIKMKSNVVVKGYQRKRYLLVGLFVFTYDNITVKEYKKITKYIYTKTWKYKLKDLWHIKPTIVVKILVIIKKRQKNTLTRYLTVPIYMK